MMDTTTEMVAAEVLRRVDEHYKKTRMPLYLSALGHRLELPPGQSLRDLVKQHISDKLVIVEDPAVRERLAVARKGEEDNVRLGLSESSGRILRYPRALLVAFCMRIPQEEHMYYAYGEHPHFRRALTPPGPPFTEIDSDLRVEGFDARDPRRMPDEEKQKLLEQIETWAQRPEIPLCDLERYEPKVSVDSSMTALDRFLAAQRPDVVPQILIPGDIAQILQRAK